MGRDGRAHEKTSHKLFLTAETWEVSI